MFLRVFTGPLASQSLNPLGYLIKIQIPRPHFVTSWIRSLGMEPRTLYSDPSSGDSDPQQSYRSTCNWVGEERRGKLPQVARSVREREGGPRSQEGADHELTPSCFSPDSPHNLT